MAKFVPKGKRIKPGQALNPKGSSAKARAMAKVRRLSADQLADVTSLLLTNNRNGLSKVAKDENASFLQVWTAKLLADSFKNGDISIYNAIIDRVVGRAKQTIDAHHMGEAGGPIEVKTEQTDEEMRAELAVLQRRMKEYKKAD